MRLERKTPPMPGSPGRAVRGSGEAVAPGRREEDRSATKDDERSGTRAWREAVVPPDNLQSARKRVKANQGSPGVDGRTVDHLAEPVRVHGQRLCEERLAGRSLPQPVRRVAIPKARGGTRTLGIPTAVDRLIQRGAQHAVRARALVDPVPQTSCHTWPAAVFFCARTRWIVAVASQLVTCLLVTSGRKY